MRKSRIITAVAVTLTLCQSLAVTAKEFKDMVSEDSWAYNALNYAIENEYISGYDENYIKPFDSLTRAQLAVILMRTDMEYEPADETMDFPDVSKDEWYYDAFVYAYKNGIFTGDENKNMNPCNNITRQEVFACICRYLKLDLSDNCENFADCNNISDWAKPYIGALYENKLIEGDNEKRINPKNEISRAELAQLIYNIHIWKDNSPNEDKKTEYMKMITGGRQQKSNEQEIEEQTISDINEDKDNIADDIF